MITCGLFLDFSKAFDTVNHEILLSKLEKYGIPEMALLWFNNYLQNRSQYLKINDITSVSLRDRSFRGGLVQRGGGTQIDIR